MNELFKLLIFYMDEIHYLLCVNKTEAEAPPPPPPGRRVIELE
jgi:hypothetical protein